MKTIIGVLLMAGVLSWAKVGDAAPPVPATYKQTHPRLPYPDSGYLDTIWAARSIGASYIFTAANNWNGATPPSGVSGLINGRYLLFAYLAAKRAGDPSAATYLQKIKDTAPLTGNFAIGSGNWNASIWLAFAYDWINADLDSSTLSTMRTNAYTLMTNFENANPNPQPYNDQFYITGSSQIPHLVLALSIYPDDRANSLPHLRYSMDLFFNQMFPIWKQIIGGDGECDLAVTGDTDTSCGGMWHEEWSSYANQSNGINKWYLLYTLTWATVTQNMPGFFTQDNKWLKNLAYWTMYQSRPDFVYEPLGQTSRPIWQSEYAATVASGNASLGHLEGLAAIYNDTTIRGWARKVDWAGATPNGYEPSAWPFYAPDSSANTATTRFGLSKVRNFPGYGVIFLRSGWGENDSFATIRYGDNHWTHPVQDSGAFTLFNRGPLAIRSGTYRSGSASQHNQFWAMQSISQNVPLVYDPADRYSDETYGLCSSGYSGCSGGSSPDVQAVAPNDGGQRRIGSANGNVIVIDGAQNNPADIAQWYRGYEYFHQGRLVNFSVDSNNKYAFIAVDTTPSYNNLFSRNVHTGAKNPREANSSNRTFRVQKAFREFVWIPRATAAYMITYDQITAADPSFVKKNLIHSINAPSITGNSFTITRAELTTSRPFPNLWPQAWGANLSNCPTSCTSATQYQYAGKLYGWMPYPTGGSLTTVGGPGHEFEITDSLGTANYNECMISQCTNGASGSNNEGLGSTTGFVESDPTSAPQQVGGYRIEEWTGPGGTNAGNKSDAYVNVYLVTNTSDTNVVSTAPTTISVASGTSTTSAPSGTWLYTTWKDNSDTCTYQLWFTKDGSGGNVKIQGAGCAATVN